MINGEDEKVLEQEFSTKVNSNFIDSRFLKVKNLLQRVQQQNLNIDHFEKVYNTDFKIFIVKCKQYNLIKRV